MTAYCQDEYYKPLFPLKGLFILLLVAIAGLFLLRVVSPTPTQSPGTEEKQSRSGRPSVMMGRYKCGRRGVIIPITSAHD